MSDLAGWPEGGRNSKFHRFKRPKGLHPRGTPLSCSLFEFLLPPFSSLPALQLCCWLTSAGQSNAFHWNTAAKGQQNSPGLGGAIVLRKTRWECSEWNANKGRNSCLGALVWKETLGLELSAVWRNKAEAVFQTGKYHASHFPLPTVVLTFALIYSSQKGFN